MQLGKFKIQNEVEEDMKKKGNEDIQKKGHKNNYDDEQHTDQIPAHSEQRNEIQTLKFYNFMT